MVLLKHMREQRSIRRNEALTKIKQLDNLEDSQKLEEEEVREWKA